MDHAATASPSPTNRARITNGSALHLGRVDGRSPVARRWRDLYAAFIDGIDADGSTVVTLLCRRAATLAVRAEQLEADLANGIKLDGLEYVRVANALNRVFVRLGFLDEADDEGDDPFERLRTSPGGGQ